MPSLMAVLGLNASAWKARLDKAKDEAKAAGKEIASSLGEEVSSKLMGLASLAAVEESIRRTIEYGEQVSILSQRLGISTDAVQAWDYALKMNGSSIQSATAFFERLASSREKALRGNEDSIRAFKSLGVAMDDLKNGRIEDVAMQIARAFEAGDPQQLIGDLREVGGRAAGEMVAAFRSGLADLVSGAKDEGVVIGESAIDGLREAAEMSKQVWMEFVVVIAPLVSGLAKMLQGVWRGLQGGVEFVAGLLHGGVQGATDAMNDLQAKFDKQDKTAADRAAKRKKSPSAGGLEEEASQKKQNQDLQHAEKIFRLKEELIRLQQAGDLKELTAAQKLEELSRRRSAIEEAMKSAGDEEGRLNAQIDLAKIDEEMSAARDQFEREGKQHRHGGGGHGLEHNALQRIGAYASAPEAAQLDTAKRSERHLNSISEGIKALVHKGSGGTHF